MKIKILNTPYNLSLLAQLGSPTSKQPQISQLIEALYANLFGVVVDEELRQKQTSAKTRKGVYKGKLIDPKQKVVVTDVIRAGIQPAHLFYLKCCQLLDPKYVRQDHIMSQRVEGARGVEATNLLGSKIGGSVKGAIVFIPDPMGATGHSVEEVVRFYETHYGKPERFVVVNLVVTPTYLKRLQKLKSNIHVYTARQDEKLTKDSFIVPGLGGVGEIINNTKE